MGLGVLPFLLLPPPSAASIPASLRCMEDAKLNYTENNRVSTLRVKKISRRAILQFLGVNHMICYASPALAAPIMPDMKDPEVIRTLKLPSGVRIQGKEFYNFRVTQSLSKMKLCVGEIVDARTL
ncbi:uncharacterized protein LOC109790955 isoform X2 [Cajanus cajan]|uniref:uncharacterized protein LOC109790955 isoform X2 n=1 Tax=Cajanus cajan TaxID=3821 RepID=UPI00098D9E6F|nr:uncharacterized protein LOC109790955 isoform X2 [Cajanus cajan]